MELVDRRYFCRVFRFGLFATSLRTVNWTQPYIPARSQIEEHSYSDEASVCPHPWHPAALQAVTGLIAYIVITVLAVLNVAAALARVSLREGMLLCSRSIFRDGLSACTSSESLLVVGVSSKGAIMALAAPECEFSFLIDGFIRFQEGYRKA